MKAELLRFIIVGLVTVAIDLVVYTFMSMFGLQISIAKAIGFISGTIFAYFANCIWTFAARRNVGSLAAFAILYILTLSANIAVNHTIIHLFEGRSFATGLGFSLSTAVSAVLNFLGMRFFVFKREAARAGNRP